ncbi:hypothetical protein, partial [Xenorhabdus bovienii]|uniref:hypothetical protein n=1 Tax=Xenorhabdus bovienii TaxID=40576 RepID=UPI00237CD9C9
MAFAFRDVDLSCLGLLCAAIGLATGNFENARGLFANLSDHQLLAVYSGAFSVLTYTLMGIRARAYFDQYSSKKNLCTIIITPAGFFKFI